MASVRRDGKFSLPFSSSAPICRIPATQQHTLTHMAERNNEMIRIATQNGNFLFEHNKRLLTHVERGHTKALAAPHLLWHSSSPLVFAFGRTRKRHHWRTTINHGNFKWFFFHTLPMRAIAALRTTNWLTECITEMWAEKRNVNVFGYVRSVMAAEKKRKYNMLICCATHHIDVIAYMAILPYWGWNAKTRIVPSLRYSA